MTFRWEIQVQGLKIAGHPHQELFGDVNSACNKFDELRIKYPNYDIVLTEFKSWEMKKHKKVEIAPKQCPRGHKGNIDGRSVLKQGSNCKWICTICGEFFDAL